MNNTSLAIKIFSGIKDNNFNDNEHRRSVLLLFLLLL